MDLPQVHLEKDWSRFDQENFVLDYFSLDMDKVL